MSELTILNDKILIVENQDPDTKRINVLITDIAKDSNAVPTPTTYDALLEIQSSTAGLLLPSITKTNVDKMTSAPGMVFYNPETDSVMYRSQNTNKPLVSAISSDAAPVTLPADIGTNGQILISKADGTTQWSNPTTGITSVTTDDPCLSVITTNGAVKIELQDTKTIESLGLKNAVISSETNPPTTGYVLFSNNAAGTEVVKNYNTANIYCDTKGLLNIIGGLQGTKISGAAGFDTKLSLNNTIGSNTYSTSIAASTTLATSYVLTLPAVAPSAGQLLQSSDSTGTLSWTNPNQYFKQPVVATNTTTDITTVDSSTKGVLINISSATSPYSQLQFDGYSPVLGDRVLVQFLTPGRVNGIYTVTDIGSTTTPWKLIRASDFSYAYQIPQGCTVTVLNGNTRSGTSWFVNTIVTTVGTDVISWTQVPKLSVTAGTNISVDSTSINKPVVNLSNTPIINKLTLNNTNALTTKSINMSLALAAATGTTTGNLYNLTFPATAPLAGQVLQSDASGNLTWVTPSSGVNIPSVFYNQTSYTTVYSNLAMCWCVCATTTAFSTANVTFATKTITSIAKAPLGIIDGYIPVLGDVILVKDQTNPVNNGVYTLSQQGTATKSWILTRVVAYPALYMTGNYIINVTGGNVNKGTKWKQTTTPIVIGTSNISFLPFTDNVFLWLVPTGVTTARVSLYGGGGAGTSLTTGSGYTGSGGGGGAGAKTVAVLTGLVPGTKVSITIGIGSASVYGISTSASSSMFSYVTADAKNVLINANAGADAGTTVNNYVALGGGGGAATLPDTNYSAYILSYKSTPGQRGLDGMYQDSSSSLVGGAGGGTDLGLGGSSNPGGELAGNGTPDTGAGGAGTANVANAYTGGAGANGICIVEY